MFSGFQLYMPFHELLDTAIYNAEFLFCKHTNNVFTMDLHSRCPDYTLFKVNLLTTKKKSRISRKHPQIYSGT